jgi:acetyl esterase/lipase
MRSSKKRITGCLLLMTVLLSGQSFVLPLWEGTAPGAIEDMTYEESMKPGEPWRIQQVSVPTLSVYLPDSSGTAGPAIVICPGGGYTVLAFDHEGFEVAEWLASRGIAAVILKYRLPDDRIMEDKSIGPLQDVQRAIRVARRRSGEWGIDAHKIGVMGFSAGGHLAATASTLYNEKVYSVSDTVSARPDFSVLVYPVISFRDSVTHTWSRFRLLGDSLSENQIRRFSTDERVNKTTPPALLIHSIDDHGVPVENTLRYFNALRALGVSCEMHLFESGGHGYGFERGKGSENHWPDLLLHWVQMHGWL